MANRYANLIPASKIKDEFQKINEGFDKLQQEMEILGFEVGSNPRKATDLNDDRENGTHIAYSNTTLNRPDLTIPGFGNAGTVIVSRDSMNRLSQIAIGMAGLNTVRVAIRTHGASWGTWQELIHTGNTHGLIGEPTNIHGTDLNIRKDTGLYKGNNLINGPSNAYFYVEVLKYSATATLQRLTRHSLGVGEMHFRIELDSVWTPWNTMWHSGNSGPFYRGTGSPEGSVSAPVGSIYQRADGGANTTLYVKQTGTGNTGWVAK